MIDPGLARKIDRFSRRAHAFHRFAHHPLCAAYRSEVVALGRLRLCRGCLLAGTGFGLGLAAGLVPPRGWVPPWPLLILLGIWLMALGRWRLPKPFSRFLPAALASFLLAAGLRSGATAGEALALGSAAAAFLFWRHYRRRGPNRAPCAGCPERGGPDICSGYSPIARREKAFRRVVGRWI